MNILALVLARLMSRNEHKQTAAKLDKLLTNGKALAKELHDRGA